MRWNFRVLDPYRWLDGPLASRPGDDFGAFLLPSPIDGTPLKIIASSGDHDMPWEHVSVSAEHRCPTWLEMCFVKDLFWDGEEPAMQLHPARSQWINRHEYVLHLWRPLDAEIPLPPQIAV